MKTKIAAILFCCSAMPSQAVVTAMSTDFDIAFVDSMNTPIPSGAGFISSGFFSGLADGSIASSTIGVINTAFQPFTSTTGVFGISGFEGFASYSSSGERVNSTSPFFDQSLYFVFGNGNDLATSSQLAIFKASGLKFPDDSAAASDADLAVKLGGASPTAGSFIMGSVGGSVEIFNTQIPTVQMAQVVPEPSTFLLSALGMAALLRRKR